jgi:hypothetical protein
MLLSTKILPQYSCRALVAWVVNVAEEGGDLVDITTLYNSIVEHLYDASEPFSPSPSDREAPVREPLKTAHSRTSG